VSDPRLDGIVARLNSDQKQKEMALEELHHFVSTFYPELESALNRIEEKFPKVGKQTSTSTDDGLSTFTFEWGIRNISLAPDNRAALPNFTDETVTIPPTHRQDYAGMLLFSSKLNTPTGKKYPMHQIYVFPDGAWKPYGFLEREDAWEGSRIDTVRAQNYAWSFLGNLSYIRNKWHPLKELPIDFGIPSLEGTDFTNLLEDDGQPE
jgi:hypothetical protein